MSSPYGQPTRVDPPQQAPPAAKGSGDLDLKTLVITAAASALAATICSKVWAPGTLASAAFTPVVVALFREALRRPTEAVSAVLPAPRRGTSSTARLPDDTPLASSDPTRVYGAGAAAPGPQADPTRVTPGARGAERPVGAEPVTVYSVRKPLRHRWRIAAITGLLGFVIAAVVVTVPELVAGKDQTTFFHPSPAKKHAKDATPTTTTTTKTTTAPTKTVTTTETETTTTPEATTPTAPEDTSTTPGATDGERGATTPTQPTTPATPATPADPATPATPDAGAATGGATP